MRSFTSSTLSVAAALLASTGSVDAFWRMPCRSRTGLARIDPLMDYGTISGHSHAIHGSGNFGFSVTNAELVDSDCTSCEVTQDKSAYWTPSLHFLYPNGTSVIVDQVGGMLAYYLLYGDESQDTGDLNITAFPTGFRMISGDQTLRSFDYPIPDPDKSSWAGTNLTTQAALRQHALGFNCLNYAEAAEASLYRHFMPDKAFLDAQCTDGLRLELMFPSCWNGKDLDSPDHRSHVAFPDLVMTGTCPEGFETKVPSIFFETIWNTYAFAGIDGEFVLSMGDPTGYGYHGDFMMGWEGGQEFLQEAVDTCTNLSGEIQDCDLFTIQTDETAAQCTFDVPEIIANDDIAGPREGLAISVPIQSGPAAATDYPVCTYGVSCAATVASTTSASASASATTTSAVVPTLSYSAAATSTGSYYDNVDAITATDSTSTTTSISTSTTDVSSSLITSSASLDGSATIISTSYITSVSEVVELVIEQVVVTVTEQAAATAAAKIRRHMDEHSHKVQSRKERRGVVAK